MSRKRHRIPLEQLFPELEQWFDSERGQLLLARQQALVDELVSSCFGYHLLQLSVDSRVELFDNSRVQHKFTCHPTANSSSALCEFEQLPFASESLDVVLLHHVQEYVLDPYQLLREIQRVTMPNGRLIIIGFNPWSPLGVYSHLGGLLSEAIWQNQLISPRRMCDWLGLLGFQPEPCYFGYHMPPLVERSDKPWLSKALKRCPTGNFYILSAIKQVSGMTPVRPKWKPAKSFSALAPVKPTASSRKIQLITGNAENKSLSLSSELKEDVA